ncbi:MAG: hypothetical protein AAGI22_01235 [Planctomycetota bacterium]
MIFRDEAVRNVLRTHFECAWESLGPVPQVRIDFGGGDVLETTLGGNVLTTFCLSDGTPFDVLPGVVLPEAYARAAAEACTLAAVSSVRTAAEARKHLRDALRPADSSSPADLGVIDLSGVQVFVGSTEEPSSVPSLDVTVSKSFGEAPIHASLPPPPSTDPATLLLGDTRKVQSTLRPAARAILLETENARTPADTTPAIFRRVLKIDLEDRYLGLRGVLTGQQAGPPTGR